MPKSIMRLEYLYVLHDKLKKVTNYKTNSSSMQYEVIIIRDKANPWNINLGTRCTSIERDSFIFLFKEYKDVFT